MLCILILSGCSTPNAPDSGIEYRIENGFLRVYDPTKKSMPIPESIPSNEPSTTENSTKTNGTAPLKNSTGKTSVKIRERLRKIHILTE